MTHTQFHPLSRKTFKRYASGDPEAVAAVNESASFLLKEHPDEFHSVFDAIETLRRETFDGPPDLEIREPITEATFRRATYEPEAAAKIMSEVERRRAKDPAFTTWDLLAELKASPGASIWPP